MAVNIIVPGRAGKVPTCPPNADKIAWHAQRVARVSALVRGGKEKPDALGAEMLYLLKAADFNFVYLAPFFYPQYLQSKTDGMLPLQFSRRRFARDVMAFNPGGISVVAGSRQLVKEQPYSARVLTPSGWTTMGALQVGDLVVGSDGRPARVLGLFEQGTSDVYRVEF